MTNAEVDDIVSDFDVLEEKYKIWRENRLNTISELRDIADYIDKVTKNVITSARTASGSKKKKNSGA